MRNKVPIPNFEHCASIPDVRGGEIVIHGSRFPVARILAELAAGFTIDQIANSYGLDHEKAAKAIQEISYWIGHLHEGGLNELYDLEASNPPLVGRGGSAESL